MSASSASKSLMYESIIQKLENEYRQRLISKDTFINDLGKYVMHLARSYDQSHEDNAQLAWQLKLKQDEVQIHADKLFCLSQSISDEHSKRVNAEEVAFSFKSETAALRVRVSELSGELTMSNEKLDKKNVC